MYTELTFSMDARSSAPQRIGSYLVPQAKQYFVRWVDRGERSYLTIMVRTSLVEVMVARVCGMHRSVRCISRNEVQPSATSVEDTAS
jgi:hypothetical protein